MANFSVHYNNYLSKCDLLNKYNKTDELKTPQLNSIIFDIPLKQLFNLITNSSTSRTFISKIELKTFFSLYLEYCSKPYINLKLDKKNKGGIALKFKISNKIGIDWFLFDFFRSVKSNSFFSYYLYINNNLTKYTDNTNINFKVPIFFIPNLNIITNSFFPTINLKEYYSTIHFNCINLEKSNDIIDNIQNLPSFWTIKKIVTDN